MRDVPGGRPSRAAGRRTVIAGAVALICFLAPLLVDARKTKKAPVAGDADSLLIVDCLLPPQIRKLGSKSVYATPRRPVRTSAADCELRGGEYVAHDRASYATSLEVWLPAAKQGDPSARNYVGEIFEKGLGGTPDYAAAAHWYGLAAEQGNTRAQINLGQLYERGLGVERDPAAAFRWYRRASGLKDLGVEFVPVAAPEPESDGEVEALKRRLEERIAEVEGLGAELERLREQMDEARERQRQESEVKSSRIAELEAVLAEREQAVTSTQQRIEQMREDITNLEQQLEEARKPGPPPVEPTLPLAGPTIQLIEPPIAETRGIQVVRAAPAPEGRLIIGRVEAPAGLMALTVNDRETATEENGLFRAEVVVHEDRTEVTVVAVDRRGQRAERGFVLDSEAGNDSKKKGGLEQKQTGIEFGRYVALVIGNNDYRHLPRLRTAVEDAKVLAGLLEQRYRFKVELLLDADRYRILSALSDLRARLTEKDNLLIYYAGHGELDEINMRGHWLPVDAEPTNTANWISNVDITDILNAMQARHVLVIADSCYSGAMTRGSLARLEAGMTPEARRTWVRAMVGKRSRTALTSGGLQPVNDAGGGRHSVFARVFLEVLEKNDDVLEGERLHREVAARVTWATAEAEIKQIPQYDPINYAGHESGEFFFVPR